MLKSPFWLIQATSSFGSSLSSAVILLTMLLSVILLLLSGASVAEGFHASPSVAKTLYYKPQQLPCIYSSAEDDIASKDEAATESMQRPRIVDTQQRSNDPSPLDLMRMMGTSPRRVFLSALTSTFIAFAANFFGITSTVNTTREFCGENWIGFILSSR